MLCHQHAPSRSKTLKNHLGEAIYEPSIFISIIMIKHNCVLDFLIPFQYESEEELENIEVFFDRIGTQVMIYIPGRHLQFINAGMHEPVLGLCFSSKHPMVPSLPNQLPNVVPNLITLNLINIIPSLFLKRNAPGLMSIQKFMDVDSGIIYRYRFNRTSIKSLFTSPSDEHMAIQALSLAVIHMQVLSNERVHQSK